MPERANNIENAIVVCAIMSKVYLNIEKNISWTFFNKYELQIKHNRCDLTDLT